MAPKVPDFKIFKIFEFSRHFLKMFKSFGAKKINLQNIWQQKSKNFKKMAPKIPDFKIFGPIFVMRQYVAIFPLCNGGRWPVHQF